MQQLAGTFADDVNAQKRVVFAMEDDLQPPSRVSADLAAGDLAVVGHTDLVGHIFLGKLLFGLADEADLGDGVDAVGVKARVGDDALVAEGAGGAR